MFSKLKRWIQLTMGLSRSEANGMLVLLPSIFIIIFSQPLYRWFNQNNEPLNVKESWVLDSVIVAIKKPQDSLEIRHERFSFNPNTATVAELNAMGIPGYIVNRIEQYRIKGGQFRVKADFSKIYGLEPTLFKELEPYILLPDKIEKPTIEKKEFAKAEIQYDLNLTDTTSLKAIQGIGSVLSKRILKYRERLGGFISSDQLKEVYGLDSTVLEKMNLFFVDQNFQPATIPINQASEQDLSKHPYISSREAKAIITYRLQHGKYLSLNDLEKVKLMKASSISRMKPYLSFE